MFVVNFCVCCQEFLGLSRGLIFYVCCRIPLKKDVTIRGHLETFWAMFNMVSLLANFDFWSTFYLRPKCDLIWLLGNIWSHLEWYSIWLHFWDFLLLVNFLAEKYDLIWQLETIWSNVLSGFTFGDFRLLVNLLAEMEQNMTWHHY